MRGAARHGPGPPPLPREVNEKNTGPDIKDGSRSLQAYEEGHKDPPGIWTNQAGGPEEKGALQATPPPTNTGVRTPEVGVNRRRPTVVVQKVAKRKSGAKSPVSRKCVVRKYPNVSPTRDNVKIAP
ncbi:hypothetical protein J6590_081427 [Homalodisca vitripennis]|nr:hypothetical protein J6590_081427 [Homalodisca vitripennis]